MINHSSFFPKEKTWKNLPSQKSCCCVVLNDASSCKQLKRDFQIKNYFEWLDGITDAIYYAYEYSLVSSTKPNIDFAIAEELKYPVIIGKKINYTATVYLKSEINHSHVLKAVSLQQFDGISNLKCLNQSWVKTLLIVFDSIGTGINISSVTILHTCKMDSRKMLGQSEDNVLIVKMEYTDVLIIRNLNIKESLRLILGNKTRHSLNINGQNYTQCFCDKLNFYMRNYRNEEDERELNRTL